MAPDSCIVAEGFVLSTSYSDITLIIGYFKPEILFLHSVLLLLSVNIFSVGFS